MPYCAVYGCYSRWNWVFSSWRIQLAEIVPMLAHPFHNRYFFRPSNPFQLCKVDSLYYYLANVVHRSIDATHIDRRYAQLSAGVAQDYSEFGCNAGVQLVWVLARAVHLWVCFDLRQKRNDG